MCYGSCLTSRRGVTEPEPSSEPLKIFTTSLGIKTRKPRLFVLLKGKEFRAQRSRRLYNPSTPKAIVATIGRLIHFGIKPDQITVSTSYAGQLSQYNVTLKNTSFLSTTQVKQIVRTTGDGFEGRENNIILVDVVRTSNWNYHSTNRHRMNVNHTSAGLLVLFWEISILSIKSKLHQESNEPSGIFRLY